MDLEKADNKYRFYVCVEHKLKKNHYECAQMAAETALKQAVENERYFLIPVSKHFPQVIDFMFINNALKPSFHVLKS